MFVDPQSDADKDYFLDLKTSRKCSLEVEPRKAWGPKVGLGEIGAVRNAINVRALSGLPRKKKCGGAQVVWPGQFR